MFPHPVGVFCTHLEPPNGHFSKNHFFQGFSGFWGICGFSVKKSFKGCPNCAWLSESMHEGVFHSNSERAIQHDVQPIPMALVPSLERGACTRSHSQYDPSKRPQTESIGIYIGNKIRQNPQPPQIDQNLFCCCHLWPYGRIRRMGNVPMHILGKLLFWGK